jgi:hypothetical protein
MSGAFEDREKAYEDKWAHEQALGFKIAARRNKLVGLWAAAELGLAGERAEDYAKAVVAADLGGDQGVLRKISGDFESAGLSHSDHVLHRKLEELLVVARDQIMNPPQA